MRLVEARVADLMILLVKYGYSVRLLEYPEAEILANERQGFGFAFPCWRAKVGAGLKPAPTVDRCPKLIGSDTVSDLWGGQSARACPPPPSAWARRAKSAPLPTLRLLQSIDVRS